MTPDAIARRIHEVAYEVAHRAEADRQEAARGKLYDAETEIADCCQANLRSCLVRRGRGQWGEGQIRRLYPDGAMSVALVAFCPFCGVRYHPEAAE